MGSKSGIINIPAGVDDGNTKKRKTTSGVAAELAEKSRSDKNGIYDPKNLLGSKKKGGKKRKTAS